LATGIHLGPQGEEAYNALPDSLAGFLGPFRGREGQEREGREGTKRKREEG